VQQAVPRGGWVRARGIVRPRHSDDIGKSLRRGGAGFGDIDQASHLVTGDWDVGGDGQNGVTLEPVLTGADLLEGLDLERLRARDPDRCPVPWAAPEGGRRVPEGLFPGTELFEHGRNADQLDGHSEKEEEPGSAKPDRDPAPPDLLTPPGAASRRGGGTHAAKTSFWPFDVWA
jgi:hypothetical protein